MRHRWSDSSQFGQSLYFTKGQIDRMCADELKKAGYMPSAPGPVNIERFVEKQFGHVVYEDMEPSFLSCTEFARTGKVQSARAEPPAQHALARSQQ